MSRRPICGRCAASPPSCLPAPQRDRRILHIRSGKFRWRSNSPPGPAEIEWARLLERAADPASLDLRDGFAAFASGMERGDLAAARAIANQTLDIARHQFAAIGEPTRAAKRSVAQPVDCARQCRAGRARSRQSRSRPRRSIARAWNCAAGCARRSATRPQALRDLSVSLEQCRRGRARSRQSRSRPQPSIARASICAAELREAVGDTPQALRDLSISLEQSRAASSAISAISKPPAPSIARASICAAGCAKAVGDTPQALRDLSISLNQVGDVERDLGNLEAARAAYRESLDLCRRLREAVGDTPQALRDLSVSLEQCRAGRARSRQSRSRPRRLSREPRSLPPAARGGRRHPAGIARPVGLARQCRAG